MKRVLIASHGLELGGAESSLLGYLHALSEKVDVATDLFLYKHFGELMQYIPKGINLLPQNEKYACLATPIKSVIKKGRFGIAFARAFGKLKAKRFIKKLGVLNTRNAVALEYSHKYTKRLMPKISDTEYDLAVSFLTPHYFVAEKVKAKTKVAYIHTDYTYIQVDRMSELKMWGAYDTIAAVSASVRDGFVKLFPELENKVCIIENINPEALIRERAEQFVPNEILSDDDIKLLSIGRFCDAKNFESIPKKAALLKAKGVNFKWYIIGYGNDELIRNAITDTATENEVIILGKRSNPYPYIKQCDIYAQPSRYEGKAVTVLEAQMLGKPVIISNYTTAKSQLNDGFDGIIAPMDDREFVETLYELVSNEDKRKAFSENCKVSDYSNKGEVDKLLSVISN